MTINKRKPWKKNLYENEGYPDNYTDPSFLTGLKKNINVKHFTLEEAIMGATRLNLQITLITLFLIVFYLMYMEFVSSELILLNALLICGTGYIIYRNILINFSTVRDDSKTAMCVLVFGYLFCPILHTLTDSISTDSIYTTTFAVFFLHLITFDYGIPAFLVSKAISVNAAIFGAICLSSRLASAFHAYVLLVTSSILFVLGPLFFSKHRTPVWLIISSTFCVYFLSQISVPVLATYLLMFIFINIICPLIFVQHQKYKSNIHGPWDEAIVKDIDYRDL